MNCEEALAQALESVDRDRIAGMSKPVAEHLHACAICRRSFELQRMTRQIIRARAPHVPVPDALRREILGSLRATRTTKPSLLEYLQQEIIARWGQAAATGGLAVATLLLIVTFQAGPKRMTDNPHGSIDMVQEAGLQLHLFQSGAMRPPVVTDRPSVLSAYLEKNGAPFSKGVRSFWGWDTYGGAVTKHGHICLAHVVGHAGKDAIYIFGIDEAEMIHDGDFHLPESGMRQLEKTGWFVTSDGDGCPVVVWKEGNAVCAAASTMKKDELLSYLASR